jgi:type I restriction enzyme, S subunit
MPESWIKIPLNTVIEANYGKALPGEHRDASGTYEVVGSSGVVGKHIKYLVEDPCLVLGRKGSVGSVYLQAQPCWPIDTTYFICPPSGIDLLYLYYLLSSMQLGELDKSTAIPGLSRDDLYRQLVPIAPLKEQTRIVEKLEELLSELDAGVAELKAAQRKLVRYRQSLLKAAVEGALTADWRAAQAQRGEPQETGAELLQRILTERRARWEARQLAKLAEQGKAPLKGWQAKYEEPVASDLKGLPSLPKSWVWATVDQLSFVVRGASPRPAGDPRYFGGEIPWITVGSLTADEGMYLDSVDQFVTTAGKDASRYIEPNTLLLTNSGATLGVPKITRIGGCINDGSVALLDVDDYLKTYLYWFLRTQTKRLRALNQGAAQPNLNTDIVRRICVPLAPRDEVISINELLDNSVQSMVSQVDSIERGLKQSSAQRKNILKAAFSGKLVPQDPSDEPAGMLLERIRAERAARGDLGKKRTRKAKEAT